MPDRRAILRFAAAAAATLTLAPLARAEPAAYDAAVFDAALSAGKPILVEISAPWCPVCRAQKAVLADLLAEPRFDELVRLEVDFDSRKDVVRALGAQQQSTLIVYSGGQEVARTVGATGREAIAELLQAAY